MINALDAHHEGNDSGLFELNFNDAIWFDNATGQDLGREEVQYNADQHPGPQGKANGLGDIEVLCGPALPTPTA